jgi:hypothetical protein
MMRRHRGFVRPATYVAAIGIAAPLLAAAGSSASTAAPAGLPLGLKPAQVNVTNDQTYRYGEPEIAANPKNPDNLVYVATKFGYTYPCQAANPSPCQLVSTEFGPEPSGLINNVPGFSPNSMFVSFDGGKRWRGVTVPAFPPGKPLPDSDIAETADPTIVAAPDGTFYFAEDAINFGNLPTSIIQDGAILVSKSTDGGLTWSTPTLTGTSVDRPFITADLSTGTIYSASSGLLGPDSTGDPNATPGTVFDRRLVASADGLHWTSPQGFGGGGIGASFSAAHGLLATAFRATTSAQCGGAASCIVFQTTRNAGATWSQHPLPNSSDSSDFPVVAADPARPGHFTVAYLNAATTQFEVDQTFDAGNTWSSQPTVVTDDATAAHWHPWMAYSPQGVLGLMWQNNPPGTGQPYGVFAAISYDGGAHFSQPLQVGSSPAPQPGAFGNLGDDFSYIVVDHDNVYVCWAGWQPGERQGFLTTAKLQAFTFSH